MIVSSAGHIDCVKELVDARADVNLKIKIHDATLLFVAIEGHANCVEDQM